MKHTYTRGNAADSNARTLRHTMSHAASVPNLARSTRDGLAEFRSPAIVAHVNTRGTFAMESSYMDSTSLNPHEHPTHLLSQAKLPLGLSPVQKGFAVATPLVNQLSPTAGGKSSMTSPSKRASTSSLAHSVSQPSLPGTGLIAFKSAIAGGAGTAPSVPHKPLAQTVILSPVKRTDAQGKTRAWSPSSQRTNGNGQAKLPTLNSPPAAAAATKKPTAAGTQAKAAAATPQKAATATTTLAKPAVTSTPAAASANSVASAQPAAAAAVSALSSKPTSVVPVAATATINTPAASNSTKPAMKVVSKPTAQVEEDSYDDIDDDFDESSTIVAKNSAPVVATETATPSAAAVQQPWWNEEMQEWSYEPLPTHYTPVIYDPTSDYSGSASSDAPAAAASTTVVAEEEEAVESIEDEVEPTLAVKPVAAQPAVVDEEDEYAEEDFS